MNGRSITNYKGDFQVIDCLACAREQGQLKTDDTFLKTKFFDVHQDYEIPIPGFVIMSSRRHIQSIDEFTPEEKLDYIETLAKVRLALRKVLNVDIVYFHQEEDTSPHFHVWIFPRYDWMAEKFGRKVESMRPIMEFSRANLKTTENLKQVDDSLTKLRSHFQASKF